MKPLTVWDSGVGGVGVVGWVVRWGWWWWVVVVGVGGGGWGRAKWSAAKLCNPFPVVEEEVRGVGGHQSALAQPRPQGSETGSSAGFTVG